MLQQNITSYGLAGACDTSWGKIPPRVAWTHQPAGKLEYKDYLGFCYSLDKRGGSEQQQQQQQQ